MKALWIVLGTGVSFALGSIPFGFLITKRMGIDLRSQGSGNIGATNVARTLGIRWALLVFLLDFLKGFAIPWSGKFFLPLGLEPFWQDSFCALAGLAAMLGHCFSPWLGGKGGKGVATGTGVLAACLPQTLWVGIPVWIALFFATRVVSIASLGAAAAILGASCFFYPGRVWLWGFSFLATALVVWQHRPNLGRLLAGKEYRF